MIAISGVLVLGAIGLLATGLVLPNLWFVYASIVVSLASAVCLVVGVFIGRGQGPARGAPSKKSTKTETKGKQAKDGGKKGAAKQAGGTKAKESAGTGEAASAPAGTAVKEVPGDAEVVVVPGRLRYHLASCRQVTRRETEALAVSEARDQGYLACTSCRPDAVLAARTDDHTETGASPVEAADDGEAERQAEHDGSGEEPAAAEPVTVTVVTGQRRYHLSSCQVVQDAAEDDAETTEMTAAAARGDGLTPCRVCGAPEGDADDDG